MGKGAVLLLLRFIGGFMSYSKEVNRYVFPLIATNIAQLLINQLALHFAENDKKRFKDLFKSSFLLDVVIGASFLPLCVVFRKSFLRLFYEFSGKLLDLSTFYLVIMSPYILLTLLTFLLTNVLKVEKKTKPIF